MYGSSGAQESWGSCFSFYEAIEAFPQPQGCQGTGLGEKPPCGLCQPWNKIIIS